MPDDDDSGEFDPEQINEEFQQESDDVGRFNLAIFGKTGVGKSTLVNAFFGEDLAQTGVGAPQTDAPHLYFSHNERFGLLDTVGLQIDHDHEKVLKELSKTLERTRKQKSDDQIHMAWFCISASSSRLEPGEVEFIKGLRKLHLPVALVVTQCDTYDGVLDDHHHELIEHINELDLPIAEGRAIPIRAQAKFAGTPPVERQPSFGLDDLLECTFRTVPEARQEAFIAAQQIDLKAKSKAAKQIIAAAAGTAALAAATPIPVASAAVLVPIQLAMMGRITAIYGIDVSTGALAAAAATTSATQLGRATVTTILKFVPGVGSVVGGAIAATTASTLTTAMGAAWAELCRRHVKGDINLTTLAKSQIAQMFITILKGGK